ncbi:MAG: hypothetical protein J6B04_03790 [Clostridia bacterium]|nr:hypothetical protein [Clostridia bacterium]
MKEVKKLLKDGKKQVLPSNDLKLNLYSELGIYQNEPELALQTTGGNSLSFGGNVKKITAIVVVAFAIIISLAVWLFAIVKNGSTPLSLSYITLDINPAVEIVLNENDEVTEVIGVNKEGAVLVYGETFTGNKEEVVSKIIELFNRCGYFKTNNDVRLYADTTAEKESEYYGTLTKAINTKLSQLGVTCSLNTAQGSLEKAKSYGVSAAKYELAESVSKITGESVKKLVKLSYDELYKREHNYNKSEIDSAVNGIQESNEYSTLKRQMRDYEDMEDALEDIERVLKRGGDTLQMIKDYNARFYLYIDFLIDESLTGTALRQELEKLEDLADDKEDEVEDEFDRIKKHYLGVDDDDDD